MKLGDKVRVTDYLVRVRANDLFIRSVLEVWEDMPEDLRLWLDSPQPHRNVKLWAPNKVLFEAGLTLRST